MTKAKARARGWCFTLNNYEQSDIDHLSTLDVDYLIIGKEVGKKGTPHLQGYLYKKSKISASTLKEMLGKRYHIERQKGTLAQAIEYCMQDEDYTEIGDRPRQGKRTDLDIIKYDIKKNVSEKEIANKYFSQWCQYRRAFREYREMHEEYDTLLVIYDPLSPSSCKNLYKYMKEKHLMMQEYVQFIWPQYYSRKYKYLLVPQTDWILRAVETHPEDDSENINYIIV